MKLINGIQTFKVKGISFDMVYVKGGTFSMGATSEQGSDPDNDEYPVHQVTLSDYYIGKFPVTQGLWKAVMGENPSKSQKGDNYPVENVSWDDCQEFIKKLNQMTGRTFALPTEAQWEFSARGGTKSKGYKYSGSNNIDDVAWCDKDLDTGSTHSVGQKQANELGIYDMSGNIWEWCADWYGSYGSSSQRDLVEASFGSNRVRRGGSWNSYAFNCRVSYRGIKTPDNCFNDGGFRLALLIDGIQTLGVNDILFDEDSRQNGKLDDKTFKVKGISFDMVYVKGGAFWMGAQKTNPDGRNHDPKAVEYYESPVHQVTLSDYYIGKFQVTQGLWKAVMGSNPSSFKKGDNYPVENVSWDDCQSFIKKLNAKTGKTFSLPTEAQWEFSARGGTKSKGYKYSGSNNIDDVAWCDEDWDTGSTHPVGQKQANELGIYDMSGNVLEWCADRYGSYSSGSQTNPRGPSSGSNRVLRGGGWYYGASGCRVSFRSNYVPGNPYIDSGFRLALLINGIQTFEVKGISFDMVYVKGGTFWMGAQKSNPNGLNYDRDADDSESPVHQVTLSDYYIGKFQVTQGLWKAVMGNNPSMFQKGDNYPVEWVSWDDCQTFIKKLNQMTGRTFALPTEAQWEFSARGGTKSKGYKYSGSNNIDDVAWCECDEDLDTGPTHPVGQKQANELGIYDMSGNVLEWCYDWFDEDYYQNSPSTNPQCPSTGSYRVLRGGSWVNLANYCGVSFRDYYGPDSHNSNIGFRLVLVP